MEFDTEIESTRRRRLVSSLLLFEPNLSTREIAARLASETTLELRSINPTTDKAWSHETIAGDKRALAAQWFLEATRDAAELRAVTQQRYEALLSAAWKRGDFKTCLGTLAALREILHLDAPNLVAILHVEQELTRLMNAFDLEFASEPKTLERLYRAIQATGDSRELN